MGIPKGISDDLKEGKDWKVRLLIKLPIYVVIFLAGYIVRKDAKYEAKENTFNEANNERFQALRKQYLYKDSLLNLCQKEAIERERGINQDLRISNHRQDSFLAVLNKVQK